MSRASEIWWERLGASLKLKGEIESAMRAGESLAVHFPAGIPWSETLYDFVSDTAASIDANRGIKLFSDDTSEEVGDYVLRRLCGRDVADMYWPGMDYGEFLCAEPGYAAHTYIVWVKDIRSQERLSKWLGFVKAYDAAADKKGLENRTQYLLEYTGPGEPKAKKFISCAITPADIRVFCYSMTVSSDNACAMYAAELAARACGIDPVLAEQILSNEKQLVEFPEDTIALYKKEGAHAAVWEAQITLCFPRLERARMDIIERNSAELKKPLPVSDGYGGKINTPVEMEFSTMQYLAADGRIRLPQKDYSDVCEFRLMRNALAHNKLLEMEKVLRLLK